MIGKAQVIPEYIRRTKDATDLIGCHSQRAIPSPRFDQITVSDPGFEVVAGTVLLQDLQEVAPQPSA